jgi:hypothetical protein
MKGNLGSLDRIVRFILGVVIIAGGLYLQTWFGVVGVVLVLTAALGFCPLYVPFGISTRARA